MAQKQTVKAAQKQFCRMRKTTSAAKGAKIQAIPPLYLMLIPGLIYLIMNNYLPMSGLVIAFKKIDYSLGIFASPWVGLQNFKFLFSNNDALKALRNTILYNLLFIVTGNVLAITVAIALDAVHSKFLKSSARSSF